MLESFSIALAPYKSIVHGMQYLQAFGFVCMNVSLQTFINVMSE
jgi:hypothetical protein